MMILCFGVQFMMNLYLSIRAADAMALAIIYSTYLQLVFDEEGHNVPDNIMDALEENDRSTFIWAANGKETLH
jgi:hypothetical protein